MRTAMHKKADISAEVQTPGRVNGRRMDGGAGRIEAGRLTGSEHEASSHTERSTGCSNSWTDFREKAGR